jgi:ribosomal silencing factor RsfS
MSLSRAVLSGISCKACSATVARSTLLVASSTLRASWAPSTSFQRSISSTPRRGEEKHNLATAGPEFNFLDITSGAATPSPSSDQVVDPSIEDEFDELDEAEFDALDGTETAATSTTSPDTSLPWYLQNRSAPTPQQAAIIPDLPPQPPPLLPTLLDYIANTAGLDEIQLFDLRHLDPPPALGPKLIMLICTARSEKHLHVSADRFCRYLRREHGLRANAAGLLGRNELKIKLRRKAKRMKMLANVGGGNPGDPDAMANLDDGIRTGWICCTVGKVEAHPKDTKMPGDDVEGFVGFREGKPGVNIVVQMFTDEKRAETDLETLWGGVLKTHERKDSAAEALVKELDDGVEEGAEEDLEAVREKMAAEQAPRRPAPPPPEPATPSPKHQFKAPRPSAGDVFPPAPSPRRLQQMRRIHAVGLRT